jgi:hypothetical protein
MSLVLSGTVGVSDVDGSAATPAIRGTDTNTGIFFPAADTIAFAEGGVESARLDSAGNLGLGVTPSAWWDTSRAFQLGSGASVNARTNNASFAEIGANVFLNSSASPTYIATAAASRYQQSGGGHFWFTAPSGTAGNAISFTQAMTLTAGGALRLANSSFPELYFDSTPGTSVAAISVDAANSAMRFFTNGSERARIHANGAFSVLSTSISGSFSDTTPRSFIAPTSASSSYLWHTSASADFNFYMNRTNTGTAGYILFGAGATVTGSITTNGTSTSYITSSDYRLKNTIAPMVGALARVAALKPCTYKWNVDGSDGEGFIAHELAEVCPDAVTGEKDAVNEDGSIKPQGIDTSFLVATLTAALQEAHGLLKDQAAAIQTLTARVTALEGAQP